MYAKGVSAFTTKAVTRMSRSWVVGLSWNGTLDAQYTRRAMSDPCDPLCPFLVCGHCPIKQIETRQCAGETLTQEK